MAEISADAEYVTTIGGLAIEVSKDGGGTPGSAYEGEWTVTVRNGDSFVFDNEKLRTGMPKTHEQVAQLAYKFASEEIDAD